MTTVDPEKAKQRPTTADERLWADALLRIATVVALSGLSPSTINRLLREERFPKPVVVRHRCRRWRAGELRRWLANQGENEGQTQ